MKYKINIAVPVPEPLPEPLDVMYTCPVCDGVETDGCLFCLESGEVSAEKLATFYPEV